MTSQFAREGAVGDGQVYVPRSLDEQLHQAVERSFVVHVQGSRMVGKTSLLLRARRQWAHEGVRAVYLGLADVLREATDHRAVANVLAASLARRAGRRDLIAGQAEAGTPSDYLVATLAALAGSPTDPGRPRLIVLLDELDVVAASGAGNAFFALLRDLQTRQVSEGEPVGVRLVLAGVRPFRHLVDDPSRVPLCEAGTAIWLDDFPNDEAASRALQQGFPEHMRDAAPALAWKALEFSGGYPQACTWLCQAMIDEGMHEVELADLEARLVRLADRERRSSNPPVFFSDPEDYLRGYARLARSVADPDPLRSSIDALWTYVELLTARQTVPFDGRRAAHLLLRWAGLARCDQAGLLRQRSPMLARFFTSSWAHDLRRSLEASGERSRPARAATTRPKVAVLVTGGTIGMVEVDGQVRAPQAREELHDSYNLAANVAEIDWDDNVLGRLKDSANITPGDWRRIALAVADRLADTATAGVVVAHGTDTMAYTASAVALALGNDLHKPVIFTGSQATLDVAHGDAQINLLRACKVASDLLQPLPEVAICFGDKVLRAVRAQKKDDRSFDAFESPLWPPLAVVTEEIEYHSGAARRHSTVPVPLQPVAEFESRILTIQQVPGLQPALLEPILDAAANGEGVRGIVVQSLGAGNLPTEDGYSLVSLVERAVAHDIPVVLGSLYPVLLSNPSKYEPAQAAITAGALPLFNMTISAIVTKLSWLLGQMPDAPDDSSPGRRWRSEWVRQRIHKNYVGETDEDVVAPPGLLLASRSDRRI